MDSENGRMTRREYRAQLGLDTETPEKREKSRDAVARLILLQSVICAAMLCLLFGIRKLSPAKRFGEQHGKPRQRLVRARCQGV